MLRISVVSDATVTTREPPRSFGALGSKPSEIFHLATFSLILGFSLAIELLKKKSHSKKAGADQVPLQTNHTSGIRALLPGHGFYFLKIPQMILMCSLGSGANTLDLSLSLSLVCSRII